jgi:protein ImuB
MRNRRYLVLHLPRLATDRIRQSEPELKGLLLATWDTFGNKRLLTGVDAPGTTLHPRQALADAQAMHPDLVLRPANAEADGAFLEQLALWAMRFTPLAFVDAPDGFVLDVTGCADLFGGEAALLERVSNHLERGGVTARGVLASIAGAAAALARAGQHGVVISPGDEAALVAALRLGVLRLPDSVIAGLQRLGLLRIGDVLRQPRAPLARRFGRTLMDVLDALTGDQPGSLPPVRLPPEFIEAVNLMEPIVTRPAIDHVLDVLLERLCQRLSDTGRGAREMTLRAFRVDRDVQEITIGTGIPSRTPAHLRRLFAHEMERLQPDLGFERMTLEAGVTNALMASQNLMATAGNNEAAKAEALGQLLDRLSQRLPVWRLAPCESHWPERSVMRVGPFDPVPAVARRSELPAPVRLLKRPVPLMVVTVVPEGPPVQVRHNGVVHPVAWADGPERIEREWWQDAAEGSGRDYYRVELATGARLWIGRAGAVRQDRPARWFLHGYMA